MLRNSECHAAAAQVVDVLPVWSALRRLESNDIVNRRKIDCTGISAGAIAIMNSNPCLEALLWCNYRIRRSFIWIWRRPGMFLTSKTLLY